MRNNKLARAFVVGDLLKSSPQPCAKRVLRVSSDAHNAIALSGFALSSVPYMARSNFVTDDDVFSRLS